MWARFSSRVYKNPDNPKKNPNNIFGENGARKFSRWAKPSRYRQEIRREYRCVLPYVRNLRSLPMHPAFKTLIYWIWHSLTPQHGHTKNFFISIYQIGFGHIQTIQPQQPMMIVKLINLILCQRKYLKINIATFYSFWAYSHSFAKSPSSPWP